MTCLGESGNREQYTRTSQLKDKHKQDLGSEGEYMEGYREVSAADEVMFVL